MLSKGTFVRGGKNGAFVTWELAKAIVPVYFIVTFLKYTPFLDWLAKVFQPAMKLFGLPGEASVPLVMGAVLNIYFAIAAIIPLQLDSKQITIIATMLLLCHSLFIETAIAKKTGIAVKRIVILRVMLAVLSGVLLNLVL